MNFPKNSLKVFVVCLTLPGLAAVYSSFADPSAPASGTLPETLITDEGSGPGLFDRPPMSEKYGLPQASASITIDRARETVNVVDTEDTVKYLPSLFVRKRNFGDTQPVLATRTWGVNSSARTLVFADDILLTALVANNNTLGAPRWGLVTPEEIERVDFLYGPFAAAYPGNSMGGVLQITTKMPDKFSGSLSQTEAFQKFKRYGTKETCQTDQTNLSLGGGKGPVAWLLTGGFQNSSSQPLLFITNGSTTNPAGTAGTFEQKNKLGAPANVVGAGGLLHTQMTNLKGKVVWDVTDGLKATYQVGLWSNDANSKVQTYLREVATGNPTFGGVGGFASGRYSLYQQHVANALSLKTDTKGAFDWDLSASNYYYVKDIQKAPFSVGAGETFTPYGRITRLDGTQWSNGDLKGIWRPQSPGGRHEVSFGLHLDRYELKNPVYKTDSWTGGSGSSSERYTNSQGVTRTAALWVQEAWRFLDQFKATVGARLENWQAKNGSNLTTQTNPGNGAITGTNQLKQRDLHDTRFSPKLSLNWSPAEAWEITGSLGQAYRFPTVGELYQITNGINPFNPNPNLKPENVISTELAVRRRFEDGVVRLSLFTECVKQALITQTVASGTFVDNVDRIRNTGLELGAQKDNAWFRGLSLFGSVTYVDSRIEADSTWKGTTQVIHKHVPYVPDWRATAGATIHPNDRWSLTGALRYSGRQYSTLDNTDNTPKVYGAFDRFMVVDARVQYKASRNATLHAGVDNLTGTNYTLFHPFPGRTFTTGVKLEF